MNYRPLGKSGIQVAPLAFGGNVFGWTADESTSFQLLDAFVERGFNLVDTANVYSAWVPGNQGGESETILGKWLKQSGKRDKIILATKVGMKMSDGEGLRRDYILKAVEQSLERLQTDVIDLYQSHKDDPDTPLEETLAAFDTLVKQGKVRAIGASNFEPDRLAESLEISQRAGLASYVSLQPEYNLVDRQEFEEKLEPLCQEKGLAVINYYSLASGFLSGKYRSETDLSKSARGSGIGQKYLNERGLKILSALDEVAQAHDTVPAVIALAWLIHRPSITAPIASATSLDQFAQLAQAVEVKLTQAEVDQLNQASAY